MRGREAVKNGWKKRQWSREEMLYIRGGTSQDASALFKQGEWKTSRYYVYTELVMCSEESEESRGGAGTLNKNVANPSSADPGRIRCPFAPRLGVLNGSSI